MESSHGRAFDGDSESKNLGKHTGLGGPFPDSGLTGLYSSFVLKKVLPRRDGCPNQ